MQAIQVIRFLTLLFRRESIRWLLRDEFTDTRAAGAVNGTPATPGPGTRMVVDTNSKLSLAAGVASFATGGVGANEPRISYGAFTRAAGRLIVFKLNVAVDGLRGGFSDNNLAGGRESCIAMGTTTIDAIDTSIAWRAIGSYSLATDYTLTIVLLAAGEAIFIKGGTFTSQTLLYREPSGTVATLYPILGVNNSTSVGTLDFIRIPEALWLPQPVCYDTMTRANGAMGNSETSGPDNQAVTARAWTDNVGTWAIAGNVATCTALAGGLGFATVDTGTTNVVMQGTLTRAGNEVGLILRYVDADNYIRAVHDGTNCQLIKRVATAETTVITAAVAIGAGAVVVVADGTSFSLYLNNAQVGATSTISDAALQTGTRQGLFTTNVGNTMDAFLVMARGGGAYSALDKWSS